MNTLEDIDVKTVNHTARWQMNRAGILNFWHYDEEEFCLEEGRIILRGTNGSGKSVTMQSFLPLVLDGDKRPQRLDPFGSRDRRLEYYLLGDTEDGHTDRTGYLWLEFYHTEKKIFKTIGIGVRARRGVAQIGFWGFLLNDGRRINHDCWLYDEKLWVEQGTKTPLNRKRLEDIIGDGGQVVQEQSAYRDMVNKALFGFQDEESYQDLLKLLLELRSPKLSKDFKPSSMYDILTRALPPLHDADLNPLTDVLEDMDQITDRLEELQSHRKEIEKLNFYYDRYCNFLLFTYSKKLLELLNFKDSISRELLVLNVQKETTELKEASIIDELEQNRHQLEKTNMELEVLNRSEAMEKQRELEISGSQLNDTRKQLKSINERINSNAKTSEKIRDEILFLNEKLSELSATQIQIIQELEDQARMMEFREHDIYHGLWQRSMQEDSRWTVNWKKDLDNHKKALLVALEAARKATEASKAVAEAEIHLGEVHKERNLLEEHYSSEEDKLDGLKQDLKEKLLNWHKHLNQLTLDSEGIRECLRTVSMLTPMERKYDLVRQPVTQAFERQNYALIGQRVGLQQQQESLNKEISRIEQELKEWQTLKEPEPVRTTGRILSRQQRGTELGAPFYAACEFHSSLSESDKAQLEETLAQAGLLDAWIVPGGKLALWHQDNTEEIWLEPNPIQGSTLADVLYGTPPLNSGLSFDDIRLALSSVEWSSKEAKTMSLQNNVHINRNGSFRLGPLNGRSFSKDRAEYIGKETRLRTKQLEIERLQTEKQNLLAQIKEIQEGIYANKEQQQQLRNELDGFPKVEELQLQMDMLLQISYRLDEVIKQEQKVEAWYKEKIAAKKEIQLHLFELTDAWSSLKQEKSISEAIELCGSYGNLISELSSVLIRMQEIIRSQSSYEEQQAGILILLEDDYEEKVDFQERERIYEAQTVQLRKLIQEMDIEDVHLQIQHLKHSKLVIQKVLEELRESKEQFGSVLTEIKVKLEFKFHDLQQCEDRINGVLELWNTEIELSLSSQWKEFINHIDDEKANYKLCKKITKEYEPFFGHIKKDRVSNEIQQTYAMTRSSLIDYVLEIDYLESGRIVISSKQDRLHPLSLKKLLEDVRTSEHEQQVLLTEKDRELYEEIILHSVGRAIRLRIHRAKDWVGEMNELMKQRNTSSGLQLSLQWIAKKGQIESDLDTETLVELLLRDSHRLDDEELEQVIIHFRNRILLAKQIADEEQGTFRDYIYSLLDYRTWFEFRLLYRKGDNLAYKELRDSKFNVLSGGEKAMSMYIPLLAATYSRYSDASGDAPKIISLDEAFAGVDDANIRDMFLLLTDMGFDYMMTSQVLWGCYDSVPRLAIYEIHRPKDSNTITLFHYRWDGKKRVLVEN
ncbi:TIGR02680 family protein [Paenibacillus pasadenensis]|uniref:TIGR02680 family protein n=1 Tax=Paenibacillus pasadenensis TaxID=217090 RepID=UPI00203DDA86|nr:TIGR02680 family protein [Paenibacillus pasadenensis]MCM3749258.1 TIGR02680 family protein [Paenibacillus pasadenensis]